MGSNVSRAASPLIGISCYLEQARFGVWDTPSALLPRSYLDGVLAAGGTPVLLPPVDGWEAGHLSRLDGLIIAGGADVDPSRYGADRDPATGPARPDRDESEWSLINTAFQVGLPILAVCRGMQLLNVVLGGTLHQHLPQRRRHPSHAPPPTAGDVRPGSRSASMPGSRLAKIIGEQVEVHCHHHQAVDRLGDDLTAVAWAADGTVEAIEVDADTFALGVQWHPEEDGLDRRLFEALIMEADQ